MNSGQLATSNQLPATDTQWPRYEVFKQDREGKPHEAVGSVHAPDGEMALLNARDVFVRRPSAISLWVVPESAIFRMTAEEVAENAWRMIVERTDGVQRPFLVFTKTSQRRSMTFVQYVGEVTAVTPRQALLHILNTGQFDAPNVWVWWLVPQEAITRSEESDETIASMFAPAYDKTYRQQSSYGFVSPTRKARSKEGQRNG